LVLVTAVAYGVCSVYMKTKWRTICTTDLVKLQFRENCLSYCMIWGFHRDDDSSRGLVCCDTVYWCGRLCY